MRRSIGQGGVSRLDPFLMLDHFNVSPPAGFPDHPHRGFSTVTYMFRGAFQHEDFCGHKGTIGPGDLQWMTAGRGIVHSEMPMAPNSEGLQLWINLARASKMVEPDYQELTAAEVPSGEANGVHVKVIAGEALGVSSPIRSLTPAHYLHFTLQPGATLHQPIDAAWNAFLYIWKGAVAVGPSGNRRTVDAFNTVLFSREDGQDGVTISVPETAAAPAEFVLISGMPIGEEVHQYGPFVMASREELQQTLRDYQTGSNGFERARGRQ